MPSPTDALDGRRRDALRNEARIVAAATRVLADDPEATMQDVADAAGLGRATVYRHFPAREALIAAIGRAAMDDLAEALERARLEEGDPLEALARGLQAIFAVGDRYRVLAAEAQQGPSAARRGTARGSFAPMAALLERARASGALAADVPSAWMQAAVGGLIAAAVRQVATGAVPLDAAPAMVMRAILSGFGPPGAA